MAGLAVIPLLPYIDHPVEKIIDQRFDAFWPPPARAGSAGAGGAEGKDIFKNAADADADKTKRD